MSENRADKSVLSTAHHDMLTKLLLDLGFQDGCISEVSLCTKPGDNYLGCLYRVQARGKRDDTDEEEEVHWVIKAMPESKARREMFGLFKYFRNEISFYENVVPTLQAMLASNGAPPLCVPRCLRCQYDGEEGMLVLEDLRVTGFTMADRVSGLSLEQCELVVQELGRMHALSLALKHTQPQRVEELRNEMQETMFQNDVTQRKHDGFNKMCQKSRDLLHESFDTNSKYLQKLDSCFGQDYYERMSDMVYDVKEPLGVFSHGDTWTNNMLFRCDDEGRPVDVRLLDFQLARYASLATDLGYLIYCCTTQSLRQDHWDTLMDTYLASVQHTLLVMAAPPDLLSRTQLDNEMRRCGGRWGLGMALLTLMLFCWSKEDSPDMESVAEAPGGFSAVFTAKSASDMVLKGKLTDVLKDVVDRGFLFDC